RTACLSLLKNETTAKIGVKNKRLRAGWDDNYRMQVLTNT
ncbi:MAG: ISAs1 family transposase, partial [Planctomycetota bacterium]